MKKSSQLVSKLLPPSELLLQDPLLAFGNHLLLEHSSFFRRLAKASLMLVGTIKTSSLSLFRESVAGNYHSRPE